MYQSTHISFSLLSIVYSSRHAVYALLIVILSIAEVPTLKALNLLKWKDEQGQEQTFRLVNRVSTDWKIFGRLLQLTEKQLDGFDEQYLRNTTTCWNRVMEHWLAGGGRPDYPPTWEGLYTLLEDMELKEIAEELKKALARAC